MNIQIHDGSGLVGYEDEDGIIHPSTSVSGKKLAGWLRNGVPSFKGEATHEGIYETTTITHPDDLFFGLALLDQFDRLGWKVTQTE